MQLIREVTDKLSYDRFGIELLYHVLVYLIGNRTSLSQRIMILYLLCFQGTKNQVSQRKRAYSTEPSPAAYTKYMNRDMRFQTMWYVRPAKPQISLRIRAA